MIEVVGEVYQFGVGKSEKKHNCRNSVADSAQKHDAYCCQNHQNVNDIESCERNGLHPFEAPIFEVENGIYIMIFNPSQPHKTNSAKNHQSPEYQTEADERGC